VGHLSLTGRKTPAESASVRRGQARAPLVPVLADALVARSATRWIAETYRAKVNLTALRSALSSASSRLACAWSWLIVSSSGSQDGTGPGPVVSNGRCPWATAEPLLGRAQPQPQPALEEDLRGGGSPSTGGSLPSARHHYESYAAAAAVSKAAPTIGRLRPGRCLSNASNSVCRSRSGT